MGYGVASSTDPMSGFFCTSKTVLARGRDRINPIGWKIGLEVAARCRAAPLVDIPITFRDREEGESNLTFKQNIEYVQQLGSLYVDRYGLGSLIVVAVSLLWLVLFILYLFLRTVLRSIQ